tara:strand:- start:277 stop:882 length:606 start_codon:yes stop_codon:yes gene_type:complete
MESSYELIDIFPTLVLKTNLKKDSKVNSGLISVLNNSKGSGIQLNDTYVLDNMPEFKDLKSKILLHIKEYFEYVYRPVDNIGIYITQSWINRIEQGGYHHRHTHPNSFISGVLYLQTQEGDHILFEKEDNPQIKVEPTIFERYNSSSWRVDVKSMDLVLFPSTLMHLVPVKNSKGIRISLSFNTFLKGVLGSQLSCNELAL